MSQSMLEKAIAKLSPGWALKRLVQRSQLDAVASGAYSATIDSRMRTHEANNRSTRGDEDRALGTYYREALRLEVRDLWRNSEIARSMINRIVDYVVWLGIWPQAQTTDEGFNEEVESFWSERYAPACDYRERPGVDMTKIQKLILTHRFLDGDGALILMEDGRVQPIEGERIRTPSRTTKTETVIDGIKLDSSGRYAGIYVSPRDANGNVDTSKSEFVDKDDIRYFCDPGRFDQVRGITDLAPSVNKLRDYDDTDMYVLNKIKADAQNLYNRETAGGMATDIPRRGYALTNSDGKDKQKVVKTEFGQIWTDGKLEAIESKTPNQQYVGYMTHEIQTISAVTGLPWDFLLMIFDGNFASKRMSLKQAMHTFLGYHSWMCRTVMTPLYHWRIAKAMARGEISQAPTMTLKNGLVISQWSLVEWSMPSMEWIDPQAEIAAEKEQYKLGVTSLRRLLKKQGGVDYRDVLKEKSQEISDAIQLANAINVKHPGANITWQDIINSEIGQKVNTPASGASQPKADDSEDDPMMLEEEE